MATAVGRPEGTRPGAGVRWVELRGRDYPRLGPLGVAQLAGGGAVALSRGAYPKPYSHTDPNEDGALVLRAQDATLLCVVDGHNGARASELCLTLVLEAATALLEADDAGFVRGVQAVTEALAHGLGRERKSRTCLLVAAIAGEHCRWAGFGDCELLRSTRSGPENPPNDFFLGARPAEAVHEPQLWSGRFSRTGHERITLVSDGIPNFLRDPTRIRQILAAAGNDAEAAGDLAHAAMNAGAGDNVAVATLGPYPA